MAKTEKSPWIMIIEYFKDTGIWGVKLIEKLYYHVGLPALFFLAFLLFIHFILLPFFGAYFGKWLIEYWYIIINLKKIPNDISYMAILALTYAELIFLIGEKKFPKFKIAKCFIFFGIISIILCELNLDIKLSQFFNQYLIPFYVDTSTSLQGFLSEHCHEIFKTPESLILGANTILTIITILFVIIIISIIF